MSCTALEMRSDAEIDLQMQVGAAADDDLVYTRTCHKYRFQHRVRYIQIVEFKYECWPRISSRVSIRNIP